MVLLFARVVQVYPHPHLAFQEATDSSFAPGSASSSKRQISMPCTKRPLDEEWSASGAMHGLGRRSNGRLMTAHRTSLTKPASRASWPRHVFPLRLPAADYQQADRCGHDDEQRREQQDAHVCQMASAGAAGDGRPTRCRDRSHPRVRRLGPRPSSPRGGSARIRRRVSASTRIHPSHIRLRTSISSNLPPRVPAGKGPTSRPAMGQRRPPSSRPFGAGLTPARSAVSIKRSCALRRCRVPSTCRSPSCTRPTEQRRTQEVGRERRGW